MTLYVSYLIAVHANPFILMVELSDGSFGLSKNCLKLGENWNFNNADNLGRYINSKHANAAFERYINGKK